MTTGLKLTPPMWTYTIKSNGVKKPRWVCNYSPHQKGIVTLAHTYAAALEYSGVRTFWSLSALHNFVVIGADATNAFTEATPPKSQLYVTINDPFRQWWMNVFKWHPIIEDMFYQWIKLSKATLSLRVCGEIWSTKYSGIFISKVVHINYVSTSILRVRITFCSVVKLTILLLLLKPPRLQTTFYNKSIYIYGSPSNLLALLACLTACIFLKESTTSRSHIVHT